MYQSHLYDIFIDLLEENVAHKTAVEILRNRIFGSAGTTS